VSHLRQLDGIALLLQCPEASDPPVGFVQEHVDQLTKVIGTKVAKGRNQGIVDWASQRCRVTRRICPHRLLNRRAFARFGLMVGS